jgi:DnaJ-class molecular chaperone
MIATYPYVMALVKMTKCPKCWGLGRSDEGVPCKNCSGTGEIEVRVPSSTEMRKNKPEKKEAASPYSVRTYCPAA